MGKAGFRQPDAAACRRTFPWLSGDAQEPGTRRCCSSGSESSRSTLRRRLKSRFAWRSEPAIAFTPVVFSPVPAALLIPHATGTERMIQTMQSRVQRNPKDPAAYSALGAAFFQRARETGDVEDFQLAEQALNKSLDLDNADFSADAAYSTMAEVCMGEHRFSDAVTYAQKALALGSGDLSSFAIVGDANADMGEYERAAVAYSRLDVSGESASQPRNVYVRDSRTSYLKFVSGDTAGAIRLMQSAVAAGTEARLPAENLAWLYYELGEYELQAGDIGAANNAYLAALNIHPGDYRALAGLGKLRGNQGRYAEAIKLYQSAIAVVPMPMYVAELGDMYTKAGNPPKPGSNISWCNTSACSATSTRCCTIAIWRSFMRTTISSWTRHSPWPTRSLKCATISTPGMRLPGPSTRTANTRRRAMPSTMRCAPVHGMLSCSFMPA